MSHFTNIIWSNHMMETGIQTDGAVTHALTTGLGGFSMKSIEHFFRI
jgi:hypothetical protein